jgi:hypothetical protein
VSNANQTYGRQVSSMNYFSGGSHAQPVSASGSRVANAVGALLAVAVSVIHVADQGGLTALKDPAYLGYGYWMLELAGVICAVLLFTHTRSISWVLALGVAAGPLIGITISRSIGLPDATDDIGNWFEPLGMLAMVVEFALVALSVSVLTRSRIATRVRA